MNIEILKQKYLNKQFKIGSKSTPPVIITDIDELYMTVKDLQSSKITRYPLTALPVMYDIPPKPNLNCYLSD